MNKLKKDLLNNIIPIIIILIYIITTEFIFGYTCPFRIIFHHNCPACGLTRAFIALIKGDIQKSLEYNYSCIFWIITIFLFIVDRYIKSLKIKIFPTLFIITCLITIVRYILIIS